jgi:glycerol-3-phosphate acyltransferase PlsX
MDPRQAGGGIFLGLNGVVVKSHGGTDALGFASAIDLAVDMGQSDVIARISADRARLTVKPPENGAAKGDIAGQVKAAAS